MKSTTLKSLWITWALVTAGFAAPVDSHGQEEDLDRAVKDQGRRVEGLTAWMNDIKSFLADWLPEGMITKPEEAPKVPESAEKVEVKEVTLTEDTLPAIAASKQEAEQQKLYLEALQEAVTKLDIRGTFPKRKQILVGAQNLNVGENIAIQFKEKLFQLEILDITEKELKMRDQKSQMQVSLGIGMSFAMPPGMSRSRPPGTFGMGGAPADPGDPPTTPAP